MMQKLKLDILEKLKIFKIALKKMVLNLRLNNDEWVLSLFQVKMSEQLIFNFPFKRSYLSQDFYVSENNINAYKLIESWPNWSDKFINIFGPKGCGKTHLINIIKNKIDSFWKNFQS